MDSADYPLNEFDRGWIAAYIHLKGWTEQPSFEQFMEAFRSLEAHRAGGADIAALWDHIPPLLH